MKPARLLVAAAALLLPCLALAQQPAPGTYVTERGWGSLSVARDGAFSLDAQGANGHSCTLEGRIAAGRAVMDDNCTVTFRREGKAWQVAPEGEHCGDYCGARASFEGAYVPEPPACRGEAVQADRKAFLADYKARRYPQAAARLEKVLANCGRLLWWMTEAEIRNDLALAQYRAGRPAACVATLRPLQDLTAEDAHFPPVEADWAKGVVPQIRFNRQLCADKLPPQQR